MEIGTMQYLRLAPLVGLVLLALFSQSCGKAPRIDQTTPEKLVAGIFACARSGRLAPLAAVVDRLDADEDARMLARAAAGDARSAPDVKRWFARGRIRGPVELRGAEAAVPILFGPRGTRKEVLHLVRRGSRWFLKSF